MVPERCLDGRQDMVDDALHHARKDKRSEYMEKAKKYILSHLDDTDLSEIEKEHFSRLKELHEERLSEQKAHQKEE